MIKLNSIEKEEILLTFPIKNLNELSYEKIVHNKVHNSEYNLAIPQGKNMLVWFRIYNDENICLLMELNQNNEIKNIYKILVSFSNNLTGTILYGKLVEVFKINCFFIEDIYYYKGEKTINKNYYNKLKLLGFILTNEILQIVLTKDTILFGLPLISTSLNNLLQDISTLPYKIEFIQFRNSNRRDILLMKYNQNKTRIFNIIADIQNDIYKLYDDNNNFIDVALIPNYKTSVMMNKLFRNIKENNNLDLLEESDDEEEFENNNIDKYIIQNKSLKLKCMFNNKFKKWYPIYNPVEVEYK
jgi:hypothetical protein